MEKLLQIREARLGFALDHHVNTRGERMDFAHYPHIRALYESVSPHIVLQGSVQSLKSEWAIVDHFACAYVGLSVFFVVPKFEARTTYVQNRVNRCVERVDEYKKIIGNGFFDSVALKSFGKGVVKYVGSNVLADFKEFPADLIVVEEVDECDQDNVEYALDRLRASRYQFTRYIGNPKITGRGINKFYQTSDQREWEVPCKSCGKFSEMDWFKTVVKEVLDKDGNVVGYRLRDEEWEEGCMREIKIICPHCGGEIDRVSQAGKWVPRNPSSNIEGYHISMLCSPINSVAGMWKRFQKAIYDPARLQQFYNSDLGLPYQGIGNRVTENILDKCIEKGLMFEIGDNVAYVPGDQHPGPCTMGIDVGGVFDVRISQHLPGNKRRAVFIGKVRTVEELHQLIERYHVEVACMDSMPEATLAQEFQGNSSIPVWLCRYGAEGKDARPKYNYAERVITIDRTSALDRAFALFKMGKTLLPENFRAILNGEFSDEVCGPIRQIVDDGSGNTKYEWSKCKDHQRHADVYDMLAAGVLNEVTLEDISVG